MKFIAGKVTLAKICLKNKQLLVYFINFLQSKLELSFIYASKTGFGNNWFQPKSCKITAAVYEFNKK